jgi:hypothetical protein
MLCNVGHVDRIVRFLAGVVLIAFGLLFVPSVVPKIVLFIMALVLWASAVFGVCYFYRLIRFSTAKTSTPVVPQEVGR